jgi:beta-lactamase class A
MAIESTGAAIRAAYDEETAQAGGRWRSLVTLVGDTDRASGPGAWVTAVEERADERVGAASVNKLAIAAAVLDLVDRGELRLDRTVELTPDLILPGDGIYHLQPVWGDRLTLANVLTAMLLLSDNTAVRLCGLVCPGPAVNDFLAGRGLVHTRVDPVAPDGRRMDLGWTTARESHLLLCRLVDGALLSPASTAFVLAVLRAGGGYVDGVRRDLTGAQRRRTATKHGSFEAGRHEVGIMFTADDRPAVMFAFFAEVDPTAGTAPSPADAAPGADGGVDPANADAAARRLVTARAALGRRMAELVPAIRAGDPIVH